MNGCWSQSAIECDVKLSYVKRNIRSNLRLRWSLSLNGSSEASQNLIKRSHFPIRASLDSQRGFLNPHDQISAPRAVGVLWPRSLGATKMGVFSAFSNLSEPPRAADRTPLMRQYNLA